MPHVTFTYQCMGRLSGTRYIRTWQMQPLAIAVLAALTPTDWERAFYVDRLETINYDQPTRSPPGRCSRNRMNWF